MSIFITPGSQAEAVKFNGSGIGDRAVTAQGDITVQPSRAQNQPVEDAHTPIPRHRRMHRFGVITMTLLADQDMSWLDNVADASLIVLEQNGRKHTMRGVTQVTDGGVQTNTTQGTTNELTFTFVTYQQSQS